MKMQDSVVLVTGANRGLGRALVEALLARGARKVYAAARSPGQLEALARSTEGRVVPLAIDVTSSASLAAAAAQAEDVGVLVNNAGVLASFDVLTATDEQMKQDFDVNFHGTLATTKAFLPALERTARAGRSAAVVNVLSIASLANVPALAAYSASKAAALSITQALRIALAKRDVRVHGVLAGAIDTDMVRAMEMPKTSPADVARGILEGVERDEDDITPDAMSKQLVAMWRSDPKALERELGKMG